MLHMLLFTNRAPSVAEQRLWRPVLQQPEKAKKDGYSVYQIT